jgi:hypothetical protein
MIFFNDSLKEPFEQHVVWDLASNDQRSKLSKLNDRDLQATYRSIEHELDANGGDWEQALNKVIGE